MFVTNLRPLYILLRRQDPTPPPSYERVSQAKTTAKRAISSSQKSILVATILSVACTLIVIGCFTWWWKRQRRKPSRRRRSPAQPSTHSTRTRVRQSPEEEDPSTEADLTPSTDVESSSAQPQPDTASRSSHLERRRIYAQSGSSRTNLMHDNEIPSSHEEASPTRAPSSFHKEAMDIDVVTPAPSSARWQALSTVASVIDKYAGGNSRLQSALGQRYQLSSLDRLVRPEAKAGESSHYQHGGVSSRRYQGPYAGDHPEPGLGGGQSVNTADVLDSLDQMASHPFGGLNPGEVSDARDDRPEDVRAGKQPAQDIQLESHSRGENDVYAPGRDAYTALDERDTLSDVSEGVYPSGAESVVDLRPNPLRVHKSSSAQLLAPNNLLTRSQRDISVLQGEPSGTYRRARENNSTPTAAAAAAALPEAGIDGYPTAGEHLEMHNRGAQGPRRDSVYQGAGEDTAAPVGYQEPPIHQNSAASSQPSRDHIDGLPAPLTLATVRRLLGSPEAEQDILEELQLRSRGVEESAIQRWRDEVVFETARRTRSDETLRPGTRRRNMDTTSSIPSARRVARDTSSSRGHYLYQAPASNVTDDDQRNEARSQDAARENAPSANSTWTTATPFTWRRP